MHMALGRNPYGPAGTGKTESAKALVWHYKTNINSTTGHKHNFNF